MVEDTFFHPNAPDATSQLAGCTLILPALSIGQVGQLSVDLVLQNMDPAVEKIGTIVHESIAPIIGSNPFDGTKSDICSACDVYACFPKKFVIVQQRAPFIKGRMPKFCSALLQWAQSVGIKTTVMLASCSAHVCQQHSQIASSKFRFIATDPETCAQFKQSNWEQFEITSSSASAAGGDVDGSSQAAEVDAEELYIPGGGIVKSLRDECVAQSMPFVAFVPFSNPGTSINEVHMVVSNLNGVYKLFSSDLKQLKYPDSWKYLKQSRGETPIY